MYNLTALLPNSEGHMLEMYEQMTPNIDVINYPSEKNSVIQIITFWAGFTDTD